MAGYNPHNGLHEYYAATGGCVADANRAEAQAMGTLMQNHHVANGIGLLASIPCAFAPVGTEPTCAYIVQSEVANGVQKIGAKISQNVINHNTSADSYHHSQVNVLGNTSMTDQQAQHHLDKLFEDM